VCSLHKASVGLPLLLVLLLGFCRRSSFANTVAGSDLMSSSLLCCSNMCRWLRRGAAHQTAWCGCCLLRSTADGPRYIVCCCGLRCTQAAADRGGLCVANCDSRCRRCCASGCCCWLWLYMLWVWHWARRATQPWEIHGAWQSAKRHPRQTATAAGNSRQ
jgi:hypothetical protein